MYCEEKTVIFVAIFASIVSQCFLAPLHESFSINIIHYNDFHARFDEFNINSTRCDVTVSPCVGGFARLYQLVKELLAKNPHSLVLDAGDTFQGTAWYNILKWNVTQHFVNLIPHDAHALGNHEFDSGLEGLVPYLQSLRAPVLVANLDATMEPSMKSTFRKSIVIEKQGRKIGIIGVTTTSSSTNFRVGNLVFFDEKDAVRTEGQLLRKQGVSIVIVLSHCGLIADKRLAQETGDLVDIIVGGHSHSLLYTGHAPSNEITEGDYPVVVTHPSGNTVLIVQALCYTKYLGQLAVTFDKLGKIQTWNGKPIFLDKSVGKNSMISRELQPFREEVKKVYDRIIGHTNVKLDDGLCYSAECLLGDFTCDAFVNAAEKSSSEPIICIINSRGIRYSIEAGDIRYGDIMEAMPFNNTVNTFKMQGKYLKNTLEHSVSKSWIDKPFKGPYTVQVAGLRVVFNLNSPVGSRVQSVMVRSSDKNEMAKYQELDLNKMYKFVSAEFMLMGGDDFKDIAENAVQIQLVGLDIDILEGYIKKNTPISPKKDNRITVLQH